MNVNHFISAYVLLVVGTILWAVWKRIKIRKQIDALAQGAIEITPEEFMEVRRAGIVGKNAIYTDFEGVYILHNRTKDQYYIGQGKSVFSRVNKHFTGSGNGDVYADYKYGDDFSIKLIELEGSGFSSLNELERVMIERYDAFGKGYNKTRGNAG